LLDGYKTYFGGAGFILMGIAKCFVEWYEGTPVDWTINFGLIITGWTIIGGRNVVEH